MRVHRVLAVAAVLLTACATAHTAGPSSNHKQTNLITPDEIANSPHERNAYELIQALRPGMLVNRGPTSIHDPGKGIVVFLDGQQFGDISSLQNISATEVQQVQFLSAGEAQARWGPGYPSGVILVTTKH